MTEKEPRTEAGRRLFTDNEPLDMLESNGVTWADVVAIEGEAATLIGNGIDAAWREVEAALPEGWSFSLTPYWDDGGWFGWEIEAHHADYEFDGNKALGTGTLGAFPRPDTALRALAAKLGEMNMGDR